MRAGDEARRRFERDLHDGAQQRLVSLALELRSAGATLPPELDDLRGRWARWRLVSGSRRVAPRPWRGTLRGARRGGRLLRDVSEALTNTAKHPGASWAEVRARQLNGWLELIVSADGRGRADVSSGSGLTGLVDRVEAIGGMMHIESLAGLGTAVRVKLPLKPTRAEDARPVTRRGVGVGLLEPIGAHPIPVPRSAYALRETLPNDTGPAGRRWPGTGGATRGRPAGLPI